MINLEFASDLPSIITLNVETQVLSVTKHGVSKPMDQDNSFIELFICLQL